MKPSHAIKPISYLKAHAAEMIREVADQHATIIITQNGEARAVLQDIGAYERLQDSVALLKILALSQKSVRDGRVAPAGEVFRRVRKRLKANP
ncbi:MAG: type II toxin-antitoxin system Phd/YefM family antitoxin [Myxococcales bacterium]|nr:type II toxin-antitoxin system Phd/YefM family antitoxin [Myxococcales bacterium]